MAELYAESMMVLTPWKMWVQIPKNENEKCGDPYKNTMRINYVLEKVIKILFIFIYNNIFLCNRP